MKPRKVDVTMRIPGDWESGPDITRRLPEGYQLSDEGLVMPDGFVIESWPSAPDAQFASIFESSCRQPPEQEELETIRRYTAKVILNGPGGSLESAARMMEAAAAILQAGGAGVFVDNSAISHGATAWLAMTEDGSPDALSFAYVSIIAGPEMVRTMGMHVLGRPEVNMKRRDADADEMTIIEVIRYLSASDRSVEDGHILADETSAKYQVAIKPDEMPEDSPMHNPWGRATLTSLRDIAEMN